MMATASHKITVRASLKNTFFAIVTPENLKQWFAAEVTGESSVGKELVCRYSNGESFTWRVLELDPEARVKWKCVEGPDAAPGTVVTFDLQGRGEETVIKCDHEDWPDSHDSFGTCNTLWGIALGKLKEKLEAGESS